jgi:hypothetical protein
MSKQTIYRGAVAAVWLSLLMLVGANRALGQAQGSTGQISGVTRDTTGAVVAGAAVRATNTQTGLELSTTSNESGIYRIVLVPSGIYLLTVEATGFSKLEVANVTVKVGQIADVNVTLGVGGVSETITVTADAIQTTVSQPDALINEASIANLPINGRRFQDFVTLTPTAQVDPQRGQISLSGQRGINSNINIDGMDYNQPFFGGVRGGERSNSAFTIPQESIKEFQVVASGYSAEFGRSTGGVVTAVTKSGTNQTRGTAFYLLRPQDLSRKNSYYEALQRNLGQNVNVAPTQQQFGGSIGGPIKKDKAFFFGSYEQQKFTNPRFVFFNLLQNVTPVDATREAYNYYQSLQTPFDQTNDAIAYLGRFDYNFSEANRLNIRYNQSWNNALNANSTGNQLFPNTVSALSNNGTEKNRSYTIVGQLTSFLKPNLVNELRAQYSREVRPRLANTEAPNVTNAIGRFGTVNFLPTTQFDWRVQIFNNLTLIKGNHSFKFGAEVNHVFADQTFAFNQFGVFNIQGTNPNTILDILSYTPSIGTGVVNRFDSTDVTYLRQLGNGRLDMTVNEYALYAQDSWRVRPNLTINYGLRWEGQYNPAPEATNRPLLDRVRGFQFPSGHRVDPSFIPDVTNQLGPRLGLAWDPTGGGKTVIRAFSGIYYARTPMLLLAGPLNNFREIPGDLSVQLPFRVPVGNPNNTVYKQLRLIGIDLNNFTLDKLPVLTPQQVQSIAGALGLANFDPFTGAQPITWADDYKNPKSYQWGGGIEREIARGLNVGADYSQVNTIYLQRNRNLNLPAPTVLAGDPALRPFFGLRGAAGRPAIDRPIPSLGSIQVRESTGRSVYQAMTLRANYRSKHAQFNAFYTLSRSLSDDDNERDAGGIAFENAYNLAPEFSFSRLDRRHQFVANTVVFLPLGFEAASTVRLRSGLPIDASVGSDFNEDIGGPDRPYSAPGVPFVRNGFRNLATYDIDLRLQKGISLGDSRRLTFSAEFFNLFNMENIQLSGAQVTNYCAAPVPRNCGFSAPTNRNFLRVKDVNGNYLLNNNPGAPFQMQLGARFQF